MPEAPICPIDLALADNVDVRFVAISSLEGMYSPDGPLIVLGSLRPRGRRSYTCAHELGHHIFQHGLRIDELLEDELDGGNNDDAEYLADRFAAALLMPKLAVLHAFAARRWEIGTSTPEQIYTIAGLFGVGYATLVGYLEGTLRLLSSEAARQLRKMSPKAIRTRVLGTDGFAGLVIIDEFWNERDPRARLACIEHWGRSCTVCGVDLAERYGPEAAGLIHVHHLDALANTKSRRRVDPIKDLRPVCPNWHAVIHWGGSPRTIERVQAMLRNRRSKRG